MEIGLDKPRDKQPVARTKPKQLFGSDSRPKRGPGRPRGRVSYRTYCRLAFEGIARAIALIGKSDDWAEGIAYIFEHGELPLKLKILEIFGILAEKRTPAVLSDEEMAMLGQSGGTGQGVHIHLHGMPGVPAPDVQPEPKPDLSDYIDVLPAPPSPE